MNLLAAILLLSSIPVPRVTKGEPKLIPFRYENSPMSHDAHGHTFPTVEPYMTFKLGVVQISGPQHQNHTALQCSYSEEIGPIVNEATGERAPGDHLILNCEDGSKFAISTIVFDER